MCNVFSNTVFSLRFSRGITPYQNYWKTFNNLIFTTYLTFEFLSEKNQRKLPFWPRVQNWIWRVNVFSNTVFSLWFSQRYHALSKLLKNLNNLIFTTYWTFEFLPGKNQKIAILATGAKLNLMCNFFSNTVFSLRFSRGITPYQNYWKPSIIWFLRLTELLSFYLEKTKKLPIWPRVQNWIWCAIFFQILFFLKI